MPKFSRISKSLSETFRYICPGFIEVFFATAILTSFTWSFAFVWTAFFGGHVPLSPIEFTGVNPWRGMAYGVFGLPIFMALGVLLSLGLSTIVAFSVIAWPWGAWGKGINIHARIEPVDSSRFRKF